MEVVEIISNFINKDNNVVEVEFKLMGDEDGTIRVDTIEFEYLQSFGYGEAFISLDIFDDIDEDWDMGFEDDDNDFIIDDDELLSFLNEYYIVYQDRLPDAEYN